MSEKVNNKNMKPTIILFLVFSLSSCVSTGESEALQAENESMKKELNEAQIVAKEQARFAEESMAEARRQQRLAEEAMAQLQVCQDK